MTFKKILQVLVAILVVPVMSFAQNTTGSLTGSVKADNGEALIGATVSVLHVPTGTVYKAQTRKSGLFDISNMQPGGPYSITVSYVNYQNETKSDVYINLGDAARVDVILSSSVNNLKEVTVNTTRKGADFSVKGGTGTVIGKDKIENLPTVGRNIQDFLRFTPSVILKGGTGGLTGISIAGQNNRFNSLYVDGAVNNDQFGLSASGTNGGQTSVGPISMDAIDQFQVMVSPYDASIGNFTGGGINATTKGGTNIVSGTAYSYTQNEKLTGKTPTGDKKLATRLNPFSATTKGASIGGAIVKNKLFYFVNYETIESNRPQPFDLAGYKGSLKAADIDNLVSTVKTKYGYDMGSYLDNPETVSAKRLATKVDWNINSVHRLSLSYRHSEASDYNTSASNSTTINFYNNGVKYPNQTNSFSAELKSSFKNGISNKLLVTYTSVVDDRAPIGAEFPRVTIKDGSSNVVFGAENFSGANLLKQKNTNITDYLKFNVNQHSLTVGGEYELSSSYNVFIRDNFGTYTYANLSDFLNDKAPTAYSHSYSLLDNTTGDITKAAASFYTGRASAFVNDEYKPTDNLTVSYGIRADYTQFLTNPQTDSYFNNYALLYFSSFNNLSGAKSGQMANPKVSISPRLGFTYKVPEQNMTIRGGVGVFTGRIPLVWPGGVYNNNGLSVGGIAPTDAATLAKIKFKADPYAQYFASDLGLSTANGKGQVDLIAPDFRLPKLIRASLAVDKKFENNWSLTVEGTVSRNINEVYYQRVDIQGPVGTLTGPDTRLIYNNAAKIVTPSVGAITGNPYTGVFVLSNQRYESQKGYAYNFTTSLNKSWEDGFSFNAFYTYGDAFVTNEPTSSQNNSQWRYMETVNGRNNVLRSRSDFSLGHRVSAFVAKKFTYAKGALSTTFSLVYNGQSGNPFSYVYSTGPVRDQGTSETNDLLYIPTTAELNAMTFVAGTLSAVDQKAALEKYILDDDYLSSHRGQYAARNGGRLPFQNVVDLKIAQDVNVKINNKKYTFQVTYDVFNFTNMINRNWGRTYFLSNDQFALVKYASATGATTPTYSFSPVTNNVPWGVSSSTAPSYSARWTSQLGIRFKF
jgi:hypothetical protein